MTGGFPFSVGCSKKKPATECANVLNLKTLSSISARISVPSAWAPVITVLVTSALRHVCTGSFDNLPSNVVECGLSPVVLLRDRHSISLRPRHDSTEFPDLSKHELTRSHLRQPVIDITKDTDNVTLNVPIDLR